MKKATNATVWIVLMMKIVVTFVWLAKVWILLKIHGFWILRDAFVCVGIEIDLTPTRLFFDEKAKFIQYEIGVQGGIQI